MASLFRPSSPADADQLAAFLKRILSLSSSCPGFDAADLTWKYWAPRADWDGSRGYVLEGNHGIDAHCGVLPLGLQSTTGRTKAAHFIDWAADPRTLAAGARLLRKVLTLNELTCAVGGAPDTRKILPLMGFRPANEAVFFARPVRPFRQAATHPQRNWKLPARLIRNLLWARLPPIKRLAGWSLESVAPDRVPAEVWSPPVSPMPSRERLPSVYAHYLNCPFTRFELFLIRRGEEAAGCILLAFVRGQARIADLWLLDESPEAYQAAYHLALVASLGDPTIVEVIACASLPLRCDALKQAGFREYRRESIMVFPADKVLPGGFDSQLLDNDTAFLSFGATDYVT
jgi:hypothetical protein